MGFFNNPLKSLRDAAAPLAPVAGATLGFMVGGPQGALLGAQLGSTVGGAIAGNQQRKDINSAISGYQDATKRGPFSMADFTGSEAYKFTMQGAMDAVSKSAAARGGLLSSNALDQAQKTAGGIAAQTEQQAFQQWLQDWQMRNGIAENVANMQLGKAGVSAKTTSNLIGGLGGLSGGGGTADSGGLGSVLGKLLGGGSGLSPMGQPNVGPQLPIPMGP